jgi:hypothetical protein
MYDTHNVPKEGWLEKKSSGVVSRFQRRYFVICNRYLTYYPDESKSQAELKGSINLEDAKSVKHADHAASKMYFNVYMASGAIIRFKASSEEDATSWMMHVNDQFENVSVKYGHTPCPMGGGKYGHDPTVWAELGDGDANAGGRVGGVEAFDRKKSYVPAYAGASTTHTFGGAY